MRELYTSSIWSLDDKGSEQVVAGGYRFTNNPTIEGLFEVKTEAKIEGPKLQMAFD